jgi:outer membrane protein assembly factor BamB
VIKSVSLLPRTSDGQQIPRIDPHPPTALQNAIAPLLTNEVSNANPGENYFGPFNTAAIHPPSGTLFIGMGGPNYHLQGPGIDSDTTPFMRAIDWQTLEDKWPMDAQDPPRYSKVGTSMYQNPGESGLSSPAVVNDVVFVTTSWVSIYAFAVADGTLLWSNQIGQQTGGLNGGYGYCLGPAIWGNYVVAGALVLGYQAAPGGILNVYGLKSGS